MAGWLLAIWVQCAWGAPLALFWLLLLAWLSGEGNSFWEQTAQAIEDAADEKNLRGR